MERRRRKESTLQSTTMLLSLMTFTFITFASAVDSPVNYDGWKVLEVILDDAGRGDSHTLNNLFSMERPSYMQILRTRRDKGVAEVAASPQAVEVLRDQQQRDQISYLTAVNDLGKMLESDSPSLRNEPLRGAVTFDRYMDIDEINDYIEDLPRQIPSKVSLSKIGFSVENRPIYLVTIKGNTGRRDTSNPIIFVDGGIHAREWISPAAVMNLIERLLDTPSLTTNIEWQIIPMLNPDGYAYTWTNDRLWRKNRARANTNCPGTDLNRNFPFHWGEAGTSSNQCSEIFKGDRAYSEPESRALRDAMTHVMGRVEAYITVHSYGQLIMHPWGYTANKDISNKDQLLSLGKGMASAIRNSDGTIFTVGSSGKALYPASGGSDDWAAGEMKVPIVYNLELRDNGPAGFILPPQLIRAAANDAWLGIKYLAQQLSRKEGLKVQVVTQRSDETKKADPQGVQSAFQRPALQRHQAVQSTDAQSAFEMVSEPLRPVPPPTIRIPILVETVQRPVADTVTSRPLRPVYQRPFYRERYSSSSEEDSSSSEESSEEIAMTFPAL